MEKQNSKIRTQYQFHYNVRMEILLPLHKLDGDQVTGNDTERQLHQNGINGIASYFLSCQHGNNSFEE